MEVPVHIRPSVRPSVRPYSCEQQSAIQRLKRYEYLSGSCMQRSKRAHTLARCVFCRCLSQADCRLLVHNDPPAGRVLSQLSPVHTVVLFSSWVLILSCPRLSCPKWSGPCRFQKFCILCCSLPRDIAQPSVYSPYCLSAV